MIFLGQAHSQALTGHSEVWQNVQNYWDSWSQRDLDGFLNYHHDAYSGWNYDEPMHKNKRSTKEYLDYIFKTREVIAFDINPIDIKIHSNTAVVHYYYSILEKNQNGEENKRNGRKTDILIKQTNKWIIIADHGGHVSHIDSK